MTMVMMMMMMMMMIHALTLAHVPEVRLVLTEQAVIPKRKACRWEKTNKCQVEIVHTGVPVRKGIGTKELWYTIPYHLQQHLKGTYPWYFVYPKKKKKTTKEKRKTRGGSKTKQKEREISPAYDD